ncbi:MAG: aminoglycoside phosphotransferase family protein [Candidatus Thorarchaeota archaeon]
MNSRIVDTIHNIPLLDIEKQLSTVVEFADKVTLSPILLEGWSSLNFTGNVNNVPKIVVKFPPTKDGPDFTRLFRIHESLAPYEICSRPLYTGKLDADGEISFIILEYLEGYIYSSPNDIKGHLFNQVTETLDKLNQIDLPFLRRNNDGNDYVDELMSPLKQNLMKWKTRLDSQISSRLDQFLLQVQDIHEQIEGMIWNPVTAHGDLYEDNIVFQQGKAMLLDLSLCCIADKLYDIAYLFSESESATLVEEEHFARKGIPSNHWHNLELIAFVSVISWSFNWLLELSFKQVEPNLAANVPTSKVMDYIDKKMKLLSSLLE